MWKKRSDVSLNLDNIPLINVVFDYGRSTCIEDMMRRETESEMTLIYYYCSYADPRSLLPSTILGNLLKQFFSKGVVSKEVERELLDAFIKSGRNPTDDVLIKHILSAVERCKKFYIIFDGLDECANDVADRMLDLLLRLTNNNADGAHVLITCREESPVMKAVQNWHRVHLGESVLERDMRSFIASSIRSAIEKGELKVTDSALEEEIVQRLAEKAHGNVRIMSCQSSFLSMLTHEGSYGFIFSS